MTMWASNLDEVISSRGEIRAGGTDVQVRRQQGISFGPVVDISRLPGLKGIRRQHEGAAYIGALTPISALAGDPGLERDYPGLVLAAGSIATPQVRAVATAGGCLLQRNQCWYFRHPAFNCAKKGGSTCPARTGQHAHGVCFDLGLCVQPHPSTLGMALLAYDAQVEVYSGSGYALRTIRDLYGDGSDPSRDHLLAEHELLTRVMLPTPLLGERAAYFRSISRAVAEWPAVEVLVRLQLDGAGAVSLARIAAGGVANVPVRLRAVEVELEGRRPGTDVLDKASKLAVRGASPLPQTGYKVELLWRTVLEMLEQALKDV